MSASSQPSEALLGPAGPSTDSAELPGDLPGAWPWRVRDAYAELRALAALTTDPVARSRALAVAQGLLGHDPSGLTPVHLTARELDVLALIGHGLPNRHVAAALDITLHTVKSHVQNVMLKLNAATRFEAVVEARRRGLLP